MAVLSQMCFLKQEPSHEVNLFSFFRDPYFTPDTTMGMRFGFTLYHEKQFHTNLFCTKSFNWLRLPESLKSVQKPSCRPLLTFRARCVMYDLIHKCFVLLKMLKANYLLCTYMCGTLVPCKNKVMKKIKLSIGCRIRSHFIPLTLLYDTYSAALCLCHERHLWIKVRPYSTPNK